jgi:hypothetical protein
MSGRKTQSSSNKQRASSVSQSPASKDLTEEEKKATLQALIDVGKQGVDNKSIAFRTGPRPTQPDPNLPDEDIKVDSNVMLFKMFEKLLSNQQEHTQALIQSISNNKQTDTTAHTEESITDDDSDTGMSRKEQKILADALKMKISEKLTHLKILDH